MTGLALACPIATARLNNKERIVTSRRSASLPSAIPMTWHWTELCNDMFLRLRARQIDAFEDQRELRRVDLDPAALRARRIGALEGAAFEALQVQPEAVAIEGQDLDPVRRAVEEDEEVAAEGVLVEDLAHDPEQAVDPAPEVDRLDRDEDAGTARRGEAQHGRASAAIAQASSRSLAPSRTRIRAPSRSRSSSAGAPAVPSA